jgi:hypothetical protein
LYLSVFNWFVCFLSGAERLSSKKNPHYPSVTRGLQQSFSKGISCLQNRENGKAVYHYRLQK